MEGLSSLSNQGMKVAAVSMLCQDERVFQAMHHAGTPCPFEGQIGSKATASLFIVNPFLGSFSSIFSTHPPMEKRIDRLLELKV